MNVYWVWTDQKITPYSKPKLRQYLFFVVARDGKKPHCSTVKNKINPSWKDAEYELWVFMPPGVKSLRRTAGQSDRRAKRKEWKRVHKHPMIPHEHPNKRT
jgi:hypothetical protein